MIMTRKDAPGMSTIDWALALVVVLTGWLATPARSGSPEVAESDGTYSVVESDEGVITVGRVASEAPTHTGVVTVAAAQGQAHASENELENRLERLEQQMSQLMEMMESRGKKSGIRSWTTPRTPSLPSAPPSPIALGLAKREKGIKYPSAYQLPPGKLKALTALMSRDDVPVLVTPGKDSIIVNGTTAQHAVFARFLSAIGDENGKSLELSSGKLEALSKLMIRSDVPIRVAPGKAHIEVIGSPLEQQAVADFIDLIDGKPLPRLHNSSKQARWPGNAVARQYQFVQPSNHEDVQKAYRLTKKKNAEAQRQAVLTERAAVREQLILLRDQAHALEKERETMERMAEQLKEKAERIEEKARRSKEQAEKMRNRIDRESVRSTHDVLEELAAAEILAAEFQHQVDATTLESDAHEVQADALALQIEMLETQADALADLEQELEELAEL